MIINDNAFKKAVGSFPTGVTVISTCHNGKLCGFTANSFASVSLKPHLVSFCQDKDSGSFDAFKMAKYFAINILASDQEEISKHFAQTISEKFDNIDYEISDISGTPLIKNCISIIECVKYNQFLCGDHMIFVGQVINTNTKSEKSPLLYFNRSYKKIK